MRGRGLRVPRPGRSGQLEGLLQLVVPVLGCRQLLPAGDWLDQALHWNGKNWSRVTVPSPGGSVGNTTNYGLALRAASSSNNSQWKQFDGANSPHPPYRELFYSADQAPQINSMYPQNNYNASSLTPELLANGSDADSWPDSLTYQFEVFNSSGTLVACSTPSSDNGCKQSGSAIGNGWISKPGWAVPEGDLKWGQVYTWVVQDYDGITTGTSDVQYIITNVPQPTVTSSAQNDGSQGISPGSSSYTSSVTDAQVTGVGPALSIERDYDSDDTSTDNAFGAGWSSILDMVVAPGLADSQGTTDTVNVTYPDGEQVGFGKNPDGTFAPPQGRYATLTATTSPAGYTLTDKNDTVYAFAKSLGGGSYGISSITDALGNTLTFGWNTASPPQITSMTSASGRSLAITWITPSGAADAHVQTVTTSDVTPGIPASALTWSYAYSGDELTGVCSPASTASCAGGTACPSGSAACTAYTYTPGNAYPDVVLNSGPVSYWRLDEASGSTAASSVLANEGSDNASYQNTTLGQAGPLPGSTATAASFNGTSSYVKLPSDLVKTGSYQSVSVWFKTTTGGGVLFGTSQDQITAASPSGSYTPSLYLGPGGDLHGEFWTGTAAPIMTSEPTDDGSWHLAVLTGAGNTQTLYLDGQVVGTLAGAIDNENLTYGYAGAGFLGGNWPNQPNTARTPSYYGGDLSDVGFWDRPLTSAEVSAMYRAGSAATGQLTRITRPSGSVYSQVGYSTVTGAVSQVTDDNGGTWQLAAPTVDGSSQEYVSSVLGQDPADYWRLNDTGTTDAVNQVNGGDATYNEVTQGVTGPFADSTADSFPGPDTQGSGSYLTLPSGLITGTGTQSVSLWFQTSTPGGVLLSSSADPIDNDATAGNYTPELYIGGGGDLNAEFWNGTASPTLSSASVADGKWHNVVLTAGTASQSVYLDGKLVASQSGTITGTGQSNVYLGAGFIGDGWPHEPNSGDAAVPDYFTGSMGEVAFYNSQLTAAQVAAEYNASAASGGKTPVETASLTDPAGSTVSYQLDPMNGDRVIAQTDGLGNTTQYGYDTSGFERSVTDPDGNTTITGHDIRGNVVSQTTCQDLSGSNCSTEYDSYYPDDTSSSLTPDARNDLQLTSRGDGSASATDNTYLTTNAYNTVGELISQTGPPVAGFPDGRKTTYTYSTVSTPAYSASGQVSGTTPPGLPLRETTPGGAATTMEYYSSGDVYQVTDPDQMTTAYTYDGLGRVLTKTATFQGSYPAALTTTYAYDAMGDVVTETDPPVTDAVTGAIHTARITTAYDADGDMTSQQVSDTTGGDAARSTGRTYNSHDQVETSTDGTGAQTSYTYDSYGNLASETDPAGNVTAYTYDPDGDLLTTTLQNYTGIPSGSQPAAPLQESARSYDPAGRLAVVTDAMQFTTAYTYTDNGLLSTETRCSQWTSSACTGSTFTEQSNTYNAAGQLVSQVTNNGKTTTGYTPDAAGRNTPATVDPAGLDRTTTYTYTPDDAVSSQTLTGPAGAVAQSTRYTYDAMGNMTSQSQYVQGGGNPDGWWQLNQASGTAVPDASGTGNNGAATSVTWSGDAGTFNGTSSQGATGGPVLNTTGSFSVSAWVNPSSLVAWEAAVSQDATQASAFQVQYDADTSGWAFGRKNADIASPSSIRAVSSNDASAGTWQYLTATYDASTGLMTLYVNGTAQGTATDTTPYVANGPLLIGRGQYAAASADYFAGSISDVQAYQRTLTAAQVSALYAQGRNGGASTSNLLTTTWTLDQRGLPTP